MTTPLPPAPSLEQLRKQAKELVRERRGKCAERRREAEAIGEHQAGERRRADGMGVERQPAHDDPRAEQAGSPREQQHLEHAALDELQLKGVEHGAESNRYSFPLQADPRLLRSAQLGPGPI